MALELVDRALSAVCSVWDSGYRDIKLVGLGKLARKPIRGGEREIQREREGGKLNSKYVEYRTDIYVEAELWNTTAHLPW